MFEDLPKGFSRRHGTTKIVEYQDYDGNWRTRVQMSKVYFDDDRKEIFLQAFRETGRMEHSAQKAGTTSNTVRQHMKNDVQFAEAVETAKEHYADKRREVVDELFFNPPTKVTKYKTGEILSEEKVLMPQVIVRYMEANIPEWKPKSDAVINNAGGVIIMPTAVSSAEEWEKMFGKKDSDEMVLSNPIDITYEKVEDKT